MLERSKWLSLLACVMLVFALAACNSGGSNNDGNGGNSAPATHAPGGETAEEGGMDELVPEKGAKLVVWEAQEQQAFMQEVGKAFEEKYGVPVSVEVVAGGDQGARLTTDGPSKTAADVLTMPHDQIGLAVKAGLLLPNEVFEEETRANNVETAVTASSYGNMLYGYPKSVETYAMFYNKDILPEPPKTWDEILAFA